MIYGYTVKMCHTNDNSILWEAKSLSIRGLNGLGDTIEYAVRRLEEKETEWLTTANRHMIKKPWQKATY